MAWNVTATSEEVHVLAEAGIVYREAGRLKEIRPFYDPRPITNPAR